MRLDCLTIWPVPAYLPVHGSAATARMIYRVEVADLFRAGMLTTGQTLHARPQAFGDSTAATKEDGHIWVNGTPYETHSGAPRQSPDR